MLDGISLKLAGPWESCSGYRVECTSWSEK